ncbi:MAG: helix-turn-helix domain-containing protein [Bacillota bacterium]
MSTLGDKLRKLRKSEGLTLRQLGEKLNLSFSILAMYEREERMPPVDKLKLIANYYDVSIDYLLNNNKKFKRDEVNNFSGKNKIPIIKNDCKKLKDENTIISEKNILKYKNTKFDNDLDNLFYFKVKEDSMKGSRIYSGDIVLVKEVDDINSGDVALINYEGKTLIRTIYKKKGLVIINAENSNYEPLILKENEIKIIGKILKVEFEI